MRRSLVLYIVILFSIVIVTQVAHARLEERITGPWLWMIAPTEPGKGGSQSTDVDSLADASEGAVTEEMIAQNGANEGDIVGDKAWTLGEISATALDNVNKVVNAIGLAEGEVDDHSAYALINIESATDQNGVIMDVGSDQSIKVWLNGEVVWTNAVDRPSWSLTDAFEVDLKAGDNLLLVKVSEGDGGWGMYVGIQASFDAAGRHYEPPPAPGDKISGPWLWMAVPTPPEELGCGAGINNVDLLAEVTGGEVDEEMVAKRGPSLGDIVGENAWTLGEISPTGNDNVNDVITSIGMGEGDVNFTASYAFVNILSDSFQDTWMFAGSDDSIKIWLNGEVVWNNPVVRFSVFFPNRENDFEESFPVSLQPGANPLLVKVGSCTREWGMFVGLAGDVQFDQAPVSVEPAGKLVTTWGRLKKQSLR